MLKKHDYHRVSSDEEKNTFSVLLFRAVSSKCHDLRRQHQFARAKKTRGCSQRGNQILLPKSDRIETRETSPRVLSRVRDERLRLVWSINALFTLNWEFTDVEENECARCSQVIPMSRPVRNYPGKNMTPTKGLTLFSCRYRNNLTFTFLPVQPLIRAQLSVVYSTIGKSTHLRCSGQVPFDGNFFWSRFDNQSLTNQTQRFRQYHIHVDVAQTSLHIREVEKSDFGLYTCRIESMAGHSGATVELKGNSSLDDSLSLFFNCLFSVSKESRRLTTSSTRKSLEQTTLRTPILKRNQSKHEEGFQVQSLVIACLVSDQTPLTSMARQWTKSYLSFVCLPSVLIHLIFSYLT